MCVCVCERARVLAFWFYLSVLVCVCIVFFEWFSFVLIVQKAVKKSKSTHEGSILSVHGGYDQQDTRVACLASAFILIQKKTFSIRIWIACVVDQKKNNGGVWQISSW